MDGGRQVAVSRARHPMLPTTPDKIVLFPPSFKPHLVVIIDAEEEFDWSAPFSRKNNRVDTSAIQGPSREIFERFGIVPTYVVDYPVSSQPAGFKPLLELLQSGKCEIGAQLHSWVTPPYEEKLSEENSYANRLPPGLEQRKLRELTNMIAETFGLRPLIYRAGRYGAGSETLNILQELKYEIDCSVLPGMKLSRAAPDYSGSVAQPYWLDDNCSVLEIPVTTATVGSAGRRAEYLYRSVASPLGRWLKLPAVASRLGIVERIRLTPEGSTIDEAKRLTLDLMASGSRVFALSYHSPSLRPGNTPYVRDQKDLEAFLRWLEEYFEFFMSQVGGVSSTPLEIRNYAARMRNKSPTS